MMATDKNLTVPIKCYMPNSGQMFPVMNNSKGNKFTINQYCRVILPYHGKQDVLNVKALLGKTCIVTTCKCVVLIL